MLFVQRCQNDHLYSLSKQTKSRKFKERAVRKPKRQDRGVYQPRKQRSDKGENLRCWRQLNARYSRLGLLEFNDERACHEDICDAPGYYSLPYSYQELHSDLDIAESTSTASERTFSAEDVECEHVQPVQSEEPKQENSDEFDLRPHRNAKNGNIRLELEHRTTKGLYTIQVTGNNDADHESLAALFLRIQESASWDMLKITFADRHRFAQIDLNDVESKSRVVALVIQIESEREQREAAFAAEEKHAEEAYASEMASVAETGRGQYCAIEGLVDRHSFIAHKDDKADPTSANMKKIMREIRKDLRRNVCLSYNTGSMFIRFDEGNPRFLQAMLTGLKGTPYFNGCFLFDIHLGDDYPVKPLQIKHVSRGATQCHANNGPGGFSPNLHQDSGKVCLSLLGTWSGPGWQANVSNVYQVLSSLLFMVFGAEHPYYMEPSYGGWEGTVANKTAHEPEVIEYDEEVLFHTAKSTILDVLRTPYVGFEEVIKMHFKVKARQIGQQMREAVQDRRYSEGFREKMQPVVEAIKLELEKLEM